MVIVDYLVPEPSTSDIDIDAVNCLTERVYGMLHCGFWSIAATRNCYSTQLNPCMSHMCGEYRGFVCVPERQFNEEREPPGTHPCNPTSYLSAGTGDFGNLIAVRSYDKYSIHPSLRPTCTRCCLAMTNMIPVCSKSD